MILCENYLNQIIITIDLGALKFKSFSNKFKMTVSIIHVSFNLGWVPIHRGLVGVRSWIYYGVSEYEGVEFIMRYVVLGNLPLKHERYLLALAEPNPSK